MQVNTDGLVIMEKAISDNDKLLTILTRKYGVIKAFARGVRNVKNKNFAATQLFCYSDFAIYKGRNKYIINEAALKKSFWSLRCDIEKLALAQYFFELILSLVAAEEQHHSEEILRLTLNSLHCLAEKDMPQRLIKSVFEMRLLSMAGYMPDLIYCTECNKSEDERFYFAPFENGILCGDCAQNYPGEKFELTSGLLYALRYTVYAQFNRMFAFSLSEESQKILARVTESYLLRCLERRPRTLDFYRQLVLN